MTDIKSKNIKNGVLKLLSEHLGIEINDINDDDSLKEDLHMSATDLSDFVHTLIDKGFDIDLNCLNTIETVSELINKISESQEF